MNEPLFCNSFTYDKKMATETTLHLYFKTKMMKLAYASMAFGIVFFMLLPQIIEALPEFEKFYSFIASTICVCFLISIFCFVLLYFLMINQGSKTSDEAMSIVTVSENEIQWKKGEKTKTFNPKKIYAFYETKNYIVAAAGLGSNDMILKKDAFSVGTSEDFIKFLKKNGSFQIK